MSKSCGTCFEISIIRRTRAKTNMVTGTLTIGSTNETDTLIVGKKDNKEGVYLSNRMLLDIVRDMMNPYKIWRVTDKKM
jgi:hypothetical protein